MRAIQVSRFGGPEVLEPVDLPAPTPSGDLTALGLLVQGTTAWHMLRTSARMAPGETVVVHAAAGGVGSLAVQLAREFGARRVIASASTPAKRDVARDLGADVAVDPAEEDLEAALREANDGHPVDVVLEMTGGPVFDASLAALAPFGRLVTYGMASRTAPSPIHATHLMATSRAVIGFWLVHAQRLPGGLRPAMEDLFDLHAAGHLRVLDGGRYLLSDARRAHEDLRSRRTHGKLSLDCTSPD